MKYESAIFTEKAISNADLSKGIINIEKYVISPESTYNEMLEAFGDLVVGRMLHSGRFEIRFNKAFEICEHLKLFTVIFNNSGKIWHFDLYPSFPLSSNDYVEKQNNYLIACKKWLHINISDCPTTETENSIKYRFDWGNISCSVFPHRDYGSTPAYISFDYLGKNNG